METFEELLTGVVEAVKHSLAKHWWLNLLPSDKYYNWIEVVFTIGGS